jgi:hypothetical protein
MTASAKPTGSTPPRVLRYFIDALLTRVTRDCFILAEGGGLKPNGSPKPPLDRR